MILSLNAFLHFRGLNEKQTPYNNPWGAVAKFLTLMDDPKQKLTRAVIRLNSPNFVSPFLLESWQNWNVI